MHVHVVSVIRFAGEVATSATLVIAQIVVLLVFELGIYVTKLMDRKRAV